MTNIVETIKNLKKYQRDNYYFLRRRIDCPNGKTTMGWILSNEKLKEEVEDKNFNKLYSIMVESRK